MLRSKYFSLGPVIFDTVSTGCAEHFFFFIFDMGCSILCSILDDLHKS